MHTSTKPQLIILPGWGGSRVTWAEFIALAEKHFDVVCIELPCFGTEPCPKEVWGIPEYAAFVQKKVKTIPKNANQKRILMGHSFGGQTAAYIAGNKLIDINGLILAAASVVRPKHSIKRSVLFVLSRIAKLPGIRGFFQKYREQIYNRIGSPDYTKTKGVQQEIYKRIIRQDQTSVLSNITVPTLLIWGKNDRYTPLRYGKRIANLIKNAELQIIPTGTHGLHHKTKTLVMKHILFYVQRIF